MLKKVVILGPESTGKSSLCQELAEHFHVDWCPEYAREYLTKEGMSYKYEDLLTVAEKQLALEEEHAAKSADDPILFVDTDMYVMKVWCEYVFDKCHRFVLEQIAERKYDLYLLCNIDLPWVKDDLREYPDLKRRKELYAIYLDLMINQNVPWVEISGDYSQRLKTGIEAVNKFIIS